MFFEVWKCVVLALMVLLAAGPAWAKKTDGCAQADQIIKHTNDAKDKAKEYTQQTVKRAEAKKKWDDALKDKGEKGTAKTKAEGEKVDADKKKQKADEDLAENKKKVDALQKEVDRLKITATDTKDGDAGPEPSSAALQAKQELEKKEPELKELKSRTPDLETAATEAKSAAAERNTAFEKAKEAYTKAVEKEKETNGTYKEEHEKEDKTAEARVKAAQQLLKEHHKIGKTAMRCPKYQVTGAGAALWQTWKTGTKTLTKALDKQMDLFADRGTQTEDERIKDAKELALGGFEKGSAKAKRFEKNITERIKETTDKRDEALAIANKQKREQERAQAELQAEIDRKKDARQREGKDADAARERERQQRFALMEQKKALRDGAQVSLNGCLILCGDLKAKLKTAQEEYERAQGDYYAMGPVMSAN